MTTTQIARKAADGPPAEPPRSRIRPPAQLTRRSWVTNANALFIALNDRDSPWSRRLRDLISLHASDLGGPDAISESEKALVRRAAMLTLQLELMEQKWAINGGEASAKQLDAYQRASGALRRILRDLGLKRRAKDVTPTLSDILRGSPP